jgi:hypothetical protein
MRLCTLLRQSIDQALHGEGRLDLAMKYARGWRPAERGGSVCWHVRQRVDAVVWGEGEGSGSVVFGSGV